MTPLDRRSPRINFQYTTQTQQCVGINRNLNMFWFLIWHNQINYVAGVKQKSKFNKSSFCCRQCFVGLIILPQSKDSSSPSEWHSTRSSRSRSQWLQQLSGCKLRLNRGWSSINWCSLSFPLESTLPLPTQPLLPADKMFCDQLNSNQILGSYNFAQIWS